MFWIDITNSAGVLQSDGPIRTGIRWRYRQRLNRAGEWDVEIPLGEPKLQYATHKRLLHCYTMRNGSPAWMGGGPLEDISVSWPADGPKSLVLSGGDPLTLWTANTVSAAVNASAIPGAGEQMIAFIFTQMPGWSFIQSGSTPELTGRFVHESALNALVATCDKMGLMFRLGDYSISGKTIFIQSAPISTNVFATNLGEAVSIESNQFACKITNIERQQSAWDLVNELIVYGAGEGQARHTLFAATEWPNGAPVTGTYTVNDLNGVSHTFSLDKAENTITDETSVTDYGGTYRRAVAFKDIAAVTSSDADMQAAANALVMAAVNRLLTSSRPQEQYRLSVTGPNLALFPGNTLWVAAQKYMDGEPLIDINRSLLVLETETQIDTNGIRIVGLTVSTSKDFVKTDGEILMDAVAQLRSYQAHPQTKNNENTLTFESDVDDDYSATFPFWFSRGTVTIQSVTLRFHLDPLRSSVKSVGGTVDATLTLPDHSHDVNVPAHDHDVPDHTHNLSIANVSPGTGFAARIVQVGSDWFVAGESLGTTPQTTTDSDSGAVTSEDGGGATVSSDDGGGVVDFPIDISSAITAVYGVFEDSAGNTYGVSALTWKVNAVTVSETPLSIGSGWYELDLTDYVINPDNLRPVASANTVTVQVTSPGAGKKVRVTAQIELRTTIQSLAVV